jgi:glycogen phosphorylase
MIGKIFAKKEKTMPPFKTTIPDDFDIPRRIHRLNELAYNLWWTWNPYAQRLFNRIDNALWERVHHNPMLFLQQVERSAMNAVAQKADYLEMYDRVFRDYDAYQENKNTWFGNTYPKNKDFFAYFSMEFGLHETLPIYSGGLGVLAGDHLKEASDLGLPLAGVGLLYTEGYFSQHVSEDGWQDAHNNPLSFANLPLTLVEKDGEPVTISVNFPDGDVTARIWELRVGRVPLYLLDTNIEANDPFTRQLTMRLYWSDLNLRVMQEILLGIGGVRALRALGYAPTVWHMNEGHAAFLTLERARELVAQGKTFEQAIEETRGQNVFTTHTPVPAGNDEFPLWLVDKYLATLWPELGIEREQFIDIARHQQSWGETFSMPILALRYSARRNAVSELHGRVSRRMWAHLWPQTPVEQVPITHVTNGVHTGAWMARRVRNLYDRYLDENWLEEVDNPETWLGMDNIPDAELWAVRAHLKRKLVAYMRDLARQRWREGKLHPVQVIGAGALLDPYTLTIGFARRFATYKRAALVMRDLERLLHLVNEPNRPVQIIFAGKAHPADEPGKMLIQEVYRTVKKAENGGRIVFLEDYDMNIARYLVQGVDVWMNTPRRPNEASGTSGMKAAINGALNFSVLDGWWREAYNGDNGWAIGEDADLGAEVQDEADAESLYQTLEKEIIPLYYGERGMDDIPRKWIAKVKDSMRTITPLFSMRRMVKEYVEGLYLPK